MVVQQRVEQAFMPASIDCNQSALAPEVFLSNPSVKSIRHTGKLLLVFNGREPFSLP